MADFLSGPKLARTIKSILAEAGSRSAIAFRRRGSEDWIMGTGSKVIANLNSGGTNPYVLHKVRVEVKQCTALHANVYVGRNHAVVSSSNVSIEALGLEGFGQAGWIEAGVLLGQVERAGKWFDELWSFGSSVITDAQWKEAERLWDLRETSHNPSSPASLTLKPARQTFLL